MNVVGHSRNIKILIIDDDEDDFIIIRRYITRIQGDNSFTLEWCGSYREGMAAVCRDNHDIYFVDFVLGPKTGLDLIEEAVAINCERPIVLLTGAGNQDIDLKAMKAGAADYLVKSELTTEKLERCIRYAVTRHEFLKALKANEQKYRGIFEKTKDFIFIADESTALLEVNQVGEALFSYTRQELTKMRLLDLLVSEADAQSVVSMLAANGEVDDFEIDLRAKNGQIVNGVLSLSGETDALGRYYIQGIIHDITALKNAEKAALQTAKIKATQSMVRTLAHEVRNPLNNIILAVEQLEIVPEEQHKVYLDIVMRNSYRINKLITELLYSSKPAVIALEKTALQQVLQKSISAAADRLALKKVALQEEYCVDEAWVMADAEKLSVAFLNIIINGIEASPADGAVMQVQIKDERDHYLVSVTDNGHGIDEEDLGQLFEPYFTSKTAGMGLGLASALSIFESHQALVQVKSKLGAGTSFHMTFRKESADA